MIERNDISPDLLPEIAQTHYVAHEFLSALSFIVNDTSRDPAFVGSHLLAYLSQDLLQSVVAIPLLVQEGILTVARRELRFVLEASIKLCFIQQRAYQLGTNEKLARFEPLLDSSSISIKNQIALSLLPEPLRAQFLEDVGRLYGQTSNYVHLTQQQVSERIHLVEAGRTSGLESAEDIRSINNLIARSLAATLTLLFHAVPSHVAGDFLVQPDGKTVNWYFTQSQYIAAIDATFDYKHERQATLATIRANSERREVERKLITLGFIPPWQA